MRNIPLTWGSGLLMTGFLASVAGCGVKAITSQPTDFRTGQDSNIAGPSGSIALTKDDIEKVTIVNNTLVPKGVLVNLGRSGDSETFVAELFRIIAGINESEKLISTASLGKPSVDQLRRQKITLGVVHSPSEATTLSDIKSRLKGEGIATDELLGISVVGGSNDIWMQDWGEIAYVKAPKKNAEGFLILDTMRNRNRGAFAPKDLAATFRIPMLELGENLNSAGQYGGNIEAMPNGIPYIGDAIDSRDHGSRGASDIVSSLKKWGNPDLITLPSQWLAVGHVDEFLAFVPAPAQGNGCGYRLLYADPLEGLLTMINKASAQEFAAFQEEYSVLSSKRMQQFHSKSFGANLAEKQFELGASQQQLATVLTSFLKDGLKGPSANLNDYDLDRLPKDLQALAVRGGVTSTQYNAWRTQKTPLVQYYVWSQLRLAQVVLDAANTLEKASGCRNTKVAIPQTFYPNRFTFGDMVSLHRFVAHLPGMTNALVLRDHVIFPDPMVQSLRDIVAERMSAIWGSAEGGKRRTHFIDDMLYHNLTGEVHCGTNVIRELQAL